MLELMQSIYPLAVFILVALDKVHHSRGLRIVRNEWSKERGAAVSVTLEVNVERSTVLGSRSAYPVATLQDVDDSITAADDTKLSSSDTA